MDKLLIEGGRPLHGEVRVSGAKNAALPILCAALLSPEPLVLTNVPRLKDVRTMQTLLAQMGVLLKTLGVQPAQGRFFSEEETDRAGGLAPPLAILSYELWQTVFGGQPLVGQTVNVEGRPHETSVESGRPHLADR